MQPAAPHATYVARTLREARERAGLGVRELARRAGTSHATLLAYERGRKVPSATTLLRVLEACNLAIDVETTPRIRERNGLERGEELRQVLELADQFPVRAARTLAFPLIRRRHDDAA